MAELTTVPWIDPSAILTRAEIGNALNSLTAADKTALMKIAKHYAKGSINFEAEDLVHEAVRRILDERRAWPKDVPPTAFLAGEIESIAQDWKSRSELPTDHTDTGEGATAERGTLSKIAEIKIIALFDDSDTQKIVMAMMNGARRAELEQLSGLNSTEYENNRKKIRRCIEKLEARSDE